MRTQQEVEQERELDEFAARYSAWHDYFALWFREPSAREAMKRIHNECVNSGLRERVLVRDVM